MKRSRGPTITVSGHEFKVSDVLSDTTFTVERRRWWHVLRRLWPFRFRGFWKRVWER